MMNWMENFDESKLYESSIFCLQLTIKESHKLPVFYRITERKKDELLLVTYDSEFSVDFANKEELLNIMGKIEIGINPKFVMGVDGSMNHLSLSNQGFNRLEFSWWESEVDEKWKPLLQIKNKLIELLNEKGREDNNR